MDGDPLRMLVLIHFHFNMLSITSLLVQDISSNQLGSQGCAAICEMLQNNVNLVDINLSNNGFGDKDTAFLLEAFKVSG